MGGVYMVVQDEFHGWKVFYPIVLLSISEKMKVLLDFLVCSFCLTIRLRVIGHGEGMVNTWSLIEGFYEVCSKLGAMVGDKFEWNVVQAEYFAVVNVHDTLYIDI
jgi:hypothetical protein